MMFAFSLNAHFRHNVEFEAIWESVVYWLGIIDSTLVLRGCNGIDVNGIATTTGRAAVIAKAAEAVPRWLNYDFDAGNDIALNVSIRFGDGIAGLVSFKILTAIAAEQYLRRKKGLLGVQRDMESVITQFKCYLATAGLSGDGTLPYYNPSGRERLVRSASWDALPWPRWINYYDQELIVKYGQELLMKGDWFRVDQFYNGLFFIVSEAPIRYDGGLERERLTRILHQIGYEQRFWEQAT